MSVRLALHGSRGKTRGGQGAFGDARFSWQWAIDNARHITEPVEELQVGETKLVPLSMIVTNKTFQVHMNEAYFNNTPPTPELDLDDPNQDMARVFNPVPKHMVKKGALFLFGQNKFKGIESFRFKNNDKLAQEWADVWFDNNMDSRVINLGQVFLREGDIFYKAVSKKTGKEIISEDLVNDKKQVKTREKVEIKFVKTSTAHWTSIVSNDNPNLVVAWIYQFKRPDGTFIREEYFRDRTLFYEGLLSEDERNKKKRSKVSKAILDLSHALKGDRADVSTVEFELKQIQEHNLGMFPLARFKNNEQGNFWGSSVYEGHYGQFDRLNEVYTQMGYAIKMNADPLLWVSGAEVADQNAKTADAVWSFQNPEASLNILQWDGIPDATFKYIELLEGKIFADAFIPRTSEIEKLFGSDNRLSGSALRELKSDIIDATMARRLDIEQGFKEMIDLVAALTDTPISKTNNAVDVVWGPVYESGTAEKRNALLEYRKHNILSRERIIELSDDFPPEMKEELKADLIKIDADLLKAQTQSQAQKPDSPVVKKQVTSRRKRKR